MLECVINISEGRDLAAVGRIAEAAGTDLLDVHTDPDHHRSVLTVLGVDAARAIAETTVRTLSLEDHDGVHPRIGVLDVVPFVPLGDSTIDDAVVARDEFAAWLGESLGVPVFRYGPAIPTGDGGPAERTLPAVRRDAFVALVPDFGPSTPHPTAGASAVGARPLLVAYNVWLDDADLPTARAIAAEVRGPGIRALGLQVGDVAQVSMNLIDPLSVGPAVAFDRVVTLAGENGARSARAELVGLVPAEVLEAIDPGRWSELDLAADRTIEHRASELSVEHSGDGREEAP